jgi:hypothetical protein
MMVLRAKNKPVDIPSAEALRRAIALMEAILTEQVTVDNAWDQWATGEKL